MAFAANGNMDGAKLDSPLDVHMAKNIDAYPPFTFPRVMPLLRRGYKQPVMADELPPLDDRNSAKSVLERLERSWTAEKAARPVSPALYRALAVAFSRELAYSLLAGTGWVTFALGQALTLRPFVNALATPGQHSLWQALISGCGFLCCVTLAGVCLHLKFWNILKVGWMMKLSCVAMLHSKLLRCTSSSIAAVSTGHVYSLATSDAVRFDNIAPIFAPWYGFVTITVTFVVLIVDLDLPSAAAGLSVCVTSVVIQLLLGKRFERLRRLTAAATDARVRLTTEVIESAFCVKTMGWEEPFLGAIGKRRAVEAASIRRAQRLRALSLGVYFSSVPLAALATFSVYLWRSPPRSDLTLGKASSTIALLTVCRTFFYVLSRFSMAIPEIYVATKRMTAFLLLPEVRSELTSPETSSNVVLRDDASDKRPLVVFKAASFAWPAPLAEPTTTTAILLDLSFDLRPGELVIVTGRVGAGKSSLLSAVLSELISTEGSVTVHPGKIAACPQPPWNVSGSVRHNITLGAPENKGVIDIEAYRTAIKVTALDLDVEMWASGDETIIGEKGLTLSGGQAARLALARAVYAASIPGGPKIALLDDVLSAVDPKVAKRLVMECIIGRLCRELKVGCILATHQRFCFPAADRVVVLSSDGRQLACAPHAEILQIGGKAAPLVSVQAADESGAEATTQEAPRKDTLKGTFEGAKSKSPALQVVTKEDRTVGAVTWHTWTSFIGSGGTLLAVIVLAMFVVAQSAIMYSDVLLLRIAKRQRVRMNGNLYYQYVGLTAAACFLGASRGVLFFIATIRAASKLHSRALCRVVYSPLSWITSNPIGRILNRFSSDLAQVDDLLSVALLEFATLFNLMFGSVIFACVALPPLIIFVLIIARYCYKVKVFVSKTMNELKRLDSITKSPVLSVFSATLHGLVAIRAFGCQAAQAESLLQSLDTNTRASFWWLVTNRFLGCVLDAFTILFLALLVSLAIATRSFIPAELSAIALIYSLQLLAFIQYSVRMFALAEQYMTSVERLLSYIRLPVESVLTEEEDQRKKPSTGATNNIDFDVESVLVEHAWPQAGAIDLANVEYRYRMDGPLVLFGISCSFAAGSKNALVGRTGSGKSSTLAAISRLHDVCGGRVLIDGVDVAGIPLSRLRRAIAVIPQSPALFSGTVHFNVDPFCEHSEASVLAVLKEARLLDKFKERNNHAAILQTPVEEGGANWSSGERQLFCLARALILRRRIVAIDEATANVDFESDAHIQTTLRKAEAFKAATLLVIAHRISTVVDSDQIIVLDSGRVVESGTPAELLASSDSHFAAMVAATQVQQEL